MPDSAKPLDADLVRRFLLGQLPEPQHTEVEQTLAETTEWLNLADAAGGRDELLRTLRGLDASEDTPLSPLMEELIPRLERLMPASPVTQSLRFSAGPSTDYPFLSPSQQQDELGRLGHYRVLQPLGAGGMGIVFAGEDSLLKRRVALKVMRPEVAAIPDACQRFIREAQAAAALDHPNVVQIYQVAESPVPFIAMPLLAGESLANRLNRTPLVPIADVLLIGKEMADGLAAAHAAGLIHRDIKPANLWLECKQQAAGSRQRAAEGNQGNSSSLDEDPALKDLLPTPFHVKILDFGLARSVDTDSDLTRPNTILGTPAYMAPEQANGLPATARSDLFSLGCVLYQVATGTRPFVGPTATAVLREVADHDPKAPNNVRPEVPLALSHLIMQLLSKEPDKRPKSAQHVAQTLRSLETAETVSYTAPGPSAGWWRKRRRLVLSATAILAAGCLAVGLFFAVRPASEKPAPGAGAASPSTPLPTPAAYQGGVDILVWRKAGDQAHKLRLTDPEALPLAPGDQIRVTARIQPAAYLYLFWINEEGKAAPVYPWEPGKWGTRPPTEVPVPTLDLPEQGDQGWKITPGREGMESLILLARDTPLTATDEELQRLLDGLPAQQPVQNIHAAAWFENGKVVENDVSRKRLDFTVSNINDPVLRLQDRLRSQLQPLVCYSAAVSFARQGKK
jgi:serine/threonine protein kinase